MVMTVTKCAVCHEPCIHNRWQEPNCYKCQSRLATLEAEMEREDYYMEESERLRELVGEAVGVLKRLPHFLADSEDELNKDIDVFLHRLREAVVKKKVGGGADEITALSAALWEIIEHILSKDRYPMKIRDILKRHGVKIPADKERGLP